MAKFGINDILNAKTKAAGQQAQTEGYKEIYLSPYEVKAAQENTHQKLENIEELLPLLNHFCAHSAVRPKHLIFIKSVSFPSSTASVKRVIAVLLSCPPYLSSGSLVSRPVSDTLFILSAPLFQFVQF